MRRSWQRSTERQVRVTATSRLLEPSRAGRRQTVEAVRIPVFDQVGQDSVFATPPPLWSTWESMWGLLLLRAAAIDYCTLDKRLAPRFCHQMAAMHSAECVEIAGLVAALLWRAVNSLSSKKRRVESLAPSHWQPWHSLSLAKRPAMFFIAFCICVSGGGEHKHFLKTTTLTMQSFCIMPDVCLPTWVAQTLQQTSLCYLLKCSFARRGWAPPAGL